FPSSPPEAQKVDELWIAVKLAPLPLLRLEGRLAMFHCEDGLEVQGKPEFFQLLPDLTISSPADGHLGRPHHRSSVDARVHTLDRDANRRLAIVHRPECGLFAPVLRYLAMVDS